MPNLTWVGHEQGSIQMFYALADPELQKQYAKKLNLFVALAPVTKLDNMNSEFIKAWSKVRGFVSWITYIFGDFEAFGEGNHLIAKYQC